MNDERKLPRSLLLLRLGVAGVMIPWTIDKLVRPEYAGAVFEHFYGLSGVGATPWQVIAIVELAIVAGFILGALRTCGRRGDD